MSRSFNEVFEEWATYNSDASEELRGALSRYPALVNTVDEVISYLYYL